MIKPYFQDGLVTIFHGDCLDILPNITGVSAVVTDPPYELGFMGKKWDSKGVSFRAETWRIIKEACLPGAPLLSFGGTRTSHRIACAIEDAGWQIRDTIMWVYGSGFPKSLDISKAIDKQKGVKREVIGEKVVSRNLERNGRKGDVWVDSIPIMGTTINITAPATPEAKLWEGYGTALKPAYEPILVCMNPLDKTFAENALEHKVAGLNIDECRIGLASVEPNLREDKGNWLKSKNCDHAFWDKGNRQIRLNPNQKGRFPANFILGYPEDEYELKEGITTTERENVVKWLYENT